MRWPTLHPRFSKDTALTPMQAAWRETLLLRVEDVLAPGLADALEALALAHPFRLHHKHQSDISFLFWRQIWPRDTVFEDPVQAKTWTTMWRLVTQDLPSFLSLVTGQALRLPPAETLSFNLYRKGSYLDAHSDHAPNRLVGFVLGLTRDRWPAEGGGHVTYLYPDRRTPHTVLTPGFDTLDVVGFYPVISWHEVPLLTTQVRRLTTHGWCEGDLRGPWEE